MSSVSDFLTEAEKERIVDVIRKAEAHTTGEIRVHLENHCRGDVFKRAVRVFHQLKMDRTRFRNGILIYIAVKEHQFAILGDEAVNKKTDPGYWDDLCHVLQERFAASHYADGIAEVVEKTGNILVQYFPNLENYQKNELPDDVSFD